MIEVALILGILVSFVFGTFRFFAREYASAIRYFTMVLVLSAALLVVR